MQPGDNVTLVVVRDGVKVEITGTVRSSDPQIVIIEELKKGFVFPDNFDKATNPALTAMVGEEAPDLLRTAHVPRKDILVWYSDWEPLP